MSSFSSQPPSARRKPLANFFEGGLMPGAAMDITSLIVIDLRSLKLPLATGREIEKSLREFLFAELQKHGDFSSRSAVDLGESVLGIAID
jgi:hypothetical protein